MNGHGLTNEERGLPSVVGALSYSIDQVLPAGDVAELRRLRPDDPSSPAFWRLCAAHLDMHLPSGEAVRGEAERRWAVILQALAELRGLHAPRAHFGRALVDADLAEGRLLRLLRARDDALADAVRVTSHHLAATATSVDCTELAHLVLSDGRTDAEEVRRRIARDYYAQLAKKEKSK